MTESRIGFRPPSEPTPTPAVVTDRRSDVQLTIILPPAQFDALARLASTRRKQRGEPFIRTNAIAGESHPLHESSRGLR